MQNHAKLTSVGKYTFLHYCNKCTRQVDKKMFPVSFLSGQSLEYIESLGLSTIDVGFSLTIYYIIREYCNKNNIWFTHLLYFIYTSYRIRTKDTHIETYNFKTGTVNYIQ